MKIIWLAPLALVAQVASAQIVGNVGGAVGGTAGSAAGASGTVRGGATVTSPDVGSTMDTTQDTLGGTVARSQRTAQDAGTTVAGGVGKPVRVRGEASVRVAQGTRCWYEPDRYYDPVYRDGYYYCERTGPGASAGVSAGK